MEQQIHDENMRLTQFTALLKRQLRNWTWPPGVSADEVIAESIEALWEAETQKQLNIGRPLRWLTATAKHKKLEKSRLVTKRNEMLDERCCELNEHPTKNRHRRSPQIEFARFRVWTELSLKQQFALTECVMFERGVTEVARELGLKRTTVNGWIMRLPKQLARDPQFQSLQN